MNPPSAQTLHPTTTQEVQQCVQAALSAGEPLEVLGAGSKRFYGRPVLAERVLSLARLAGVVDYLPGELIVVVRPGTPLAELEQVLGAQGQGLAFEPPHWGEGATIGGAIGCNLAGPRRPRAGAARDHLLGFEAVTGRGEIIRGGGRVVKNVTGYDMSKLMCGSFGTLAVLTEVILKVLPAPATERTVAVPGLEEAEGLALMTAVANSPHEPGGLAHLPGEVQAPEPLADLAAGGTPLTLIRVEGPATSVEFRSGQIAQLSPRQAVYLEREDSREVWRALRELEPLPLLDGEQLWRFSVPPAQCVELVRDFREKQTPRLFYDWGGAQVWAALSAKPSASRWHKSAARVGGHGRIVRASPEADETLAVFPPLQPVKETLHRNLKNAFDPEGILNPGRMYPQW